MIQAVIILTLLLGGATYGITKQWQRNTDLKEQLASVQGELDRATLEAKNAADADRKHLQEIARLNRTVVEGTRRVAAVVDDDCADRELSAGALASLGVYIDPNRPTPAPPTSRTASHPDVRR